MRLAAGAHQGRKRSACVIDERVRCADINHFRSTMPCGDVCFAKGTAALMARMTRAHGPHQVIDHSVRRHGSACCCIAFVPSTLLEAARRAVVGVGVVALARGRRPAVMLLPGALHAGQHEHGEIAGPRVRDWFRLRMADSRRCRWLRSSRRRDRLRRRTARLDDGNGSLRTADRLRRRYICHWHDIGSGRQCCFAILGRVLRVGTFQT